MIAVRFRFPLQPDKVDDVLAAIRDVVGPSRSLPGVVSFDIGRDVTDANVLVGIEVFEDREALDRQEAQDEVKRVLSLLPDSLAAAPEAELLEIASVSPHGG